MLTSYLHYDIEKKLGEGGMGVVYLAQDTKLNRSVALKFLPKHISLNVAERERFLKEAQAAALLNHPNIAQVHAIEDAHDEQFIVMEYVEGTELKKLIYDGRLTIEEKLKIAEEVAHGLKMAHKKGIIHRDIKTSNIMIDSEGQAKIMDFGVALIQGTEHITKTGTMLGTTAYMAPEQLSGQEADVRSDIWSYGVVLYELFSGKLPFEGLYDQAVIYAIAEEEPVPISQISANVPDRIEQVIQCCLEKNPAKRYQSFNEIINALSEKGTLKSKESSLSGAVYLYVGLFAVLVFGVLAFIQPFQNVGLEDGLPEKKYLAVLPIENIGQDQNLRQVSDGLAEIFSYKLSEIEKYEDSYWVAPAQEMRNERINSASQANKQFGVNLAILSSIQTFADSTRLILELVDADNVRRLETAQVVVPSQNLALLEQNGVKAMLNMLEIEIDAEINKKLIEGESSQPEAYENYLKGLAGLQNYYSADSLEKAIQFFEIATEIDPEFTLAYAGLGEAYWRKYESTASVNIVGQAEKALNKALRLNKNLAPVQSLLGTVKAGTGEYAEAISHYQEAIKTDPKYTSAYRGLASVYEEQGNVERAEETYLRAIELKPDFWLGYSELGLLYYRTGDYGNAIEQFQKVITIAPSNSTAYSNLGAAYLFNEQIEDARQMFENSLALEKNMFAASNLAYIYFIEEDYQNSAKMYEIVVETNPDRYDLWGNLASVYVSANEPEKARKSYFKAIEKAHEQLNVNPNDAELLADIGAYYSDVEDTTNSLKYLTKALELNAENIEVRKRAVSTYEQLGKRGQALKWLDRAMISDLESQPALEQLVADPRYKAWKATVTAKEQ